MPRFRSKKGGVKLRAQPLAAQLASDAAGAPLKQPGRRGLGVDANRKRAASEGDDEDNAPVPSKISTKLLKLAHEQQDEESRRTAAVPDAGAAVTTSVSFAPTFAGLPMTERRPRGGGGGGGDDDDDELDDDDEDNISLDGGSVNGAFAALGEGTALPEAEVCDRVSLALSCTRFLIFCDTRRRG